VKGLLIFVCSALFGLSFSAGAAEATPDALVKEADLA
jgi:hypothetical protein